MARLAFSSLFTLALLLAPGLASAVRNPSAVTEADAGPSRGAWHAAAQAALEHGPAWTTFRARHGGWRALWNERTGTPHLATGPAIALPGVSLDAVGIDRALRAFVAASPEVFGGVPPADLSLARAQRVANVWYVSYRHTIGGTPVLFEDWEFRVGASGRLMEFGVDAHPSRSAGAAVPILDAAAARAAARTALGLDAGARVEGGEGLAWLPVDDGGATSLRLVRMVSARATTPPASWIALVDARDGTLRGRHDRLRYDIEGTAQGPVHLDSPSGPPEERPFAHEGVDVGGNTVLTDDAGVYRSPAVGSVTVTSALFGSFCDVERWDGPNASFSTGATDPSAIFIDWDDSNSQISERDAYYHVNLVHDHFHTLDAGFTGDDYSMPCLVNYGATCNAFWDGIGLNFFVAGDGCPNTATMRDVVYHEYGHSVNDNLYLQAGAPLGMTNGALHEGLADVCSAFIRDDPSIGVDFFGPGTLLRTISNGNRWPEDRSTDPHQTGLIVGGAMWDLRQSIGLPLAEHLSHFAKYGIPDDSDDGMAMAEYFVQVLVADDNDGNLDNGTPHYAAIAAAFNAHGIGTGLFINISHEPLEDQPAAGPYALTAVITYSGPGGIDASNTRAQYSVNGAAFISTPLSPIGSDQFQASIPAPQGSIVRYYLTVTDLSGASRSLPESAPTWTFTFLAGETVTDAVHDMEYDAGWTPADPQDNATTGRWQWVVPEGSFVGDQPCQPGQDHTPYGVACFVTQNPIGPSTAPGDYDVDNGRTTLYTSILDASPITVGTHPVLEYYRWYTNDLGNAPGSDLWRVDISNNDGATWVPVEATSSSNNSWQRMAFFIGDYVTPTSSMRLRFIAEDAGNPSLVEAAVDDLRLLHFNAGATGVESEAPGARALALEAPAPNPSSGDTHLTFTLPARAPVTLAIYDVSGRRVRVVERGTLEPGPHRATWDGRDEQGHRVATGLYFARLEAAERTLTRRLARSP